MKYICFIIFTIISAQYSFSQILSIKDSDTKNPVSFAVILDEATKTYVTANAQGQVDISAFEKKETIEIRSFGYKALVTTFSELKASEFEVFLEVSNLHLDEVVISATGWHQISGNVPSKIISISPKDIALQNPQTAADLLAASGYVYIQKSQQGGGSPMIRGFATNRLLYTIDGIRMNTAIFRGGNIQNVINVDPFTVEHTEILFGTGSVIYGSDAIGGVMSFQTLTPRFSLTEKPMISGNAVTRYSSSNKEKTGHFDIHVGWKKWAFVTSISAWDFDNLKQGSKGPEEYLKPFYVQRTDSSDHVIFQNDPLLQIPSAYSQLNLMHKIRFKPNDKLDLQFGFHYSETSPYGRYDRHNRMKNDLPRYAEWNYGPQKWMMNNLNIVLSNPNIFYDQLTLRTAVQFFEESRIDRSFNNVSQTTQTETVDAYSANIDFIKPYAKKNSLFYGIEYVINKVASDGFITDISTKVIENGPSRYPQSIWSSASAYINNEFKISDKFLILGGIRYSKFMLNADFDTTFYPIPFTEASINNGALTGSAGSVFHATKTFVINTNFGTAFRSPNVDDLGKIFDSEPGTVTVPNKDLNAEYAYNFDIDVAKTINDFLKIDVSAFYTILQNALVRRDFTLNGADSIMYDGELSKVQAIQNAAVANVYGIQAGIEINLSNGFLLSSDVSYQKGEEELDDGTISPSRHAAPLFGNSKLCYRSNKLNIQLYSIYQAEKTYEELAEEEKYKDEIYAKDENGNNYSPAWYTLNFKSMYQVSENVSLSAGIENITNQRYRTYSSGISGAGRNFFLSFKLSF
jgi:hemoglobin/transferrin/lactoferrin receptor protein